MTRTIWLVRVFLCILAASSVLSPPIHSQTSKPPTIRVDTTLVVVRVAVLDRNHMFSVSKKEWECMRADQQHFYGLGLTRPYIPKACWGLVVRDLKASDFHLFVEGAEQTIQGFNFERANALVRDNFGVHNEFSFTPTGKWSTADWPLPTAETVPVDEAENFHYFYNLAFAPEGPLSTSCHKIKLRVDRPHAVVYYRPEYCAEQTFFAPLTGSAFGKQLEREAESDEPGTLPLAYQLGSFYTNDGKSRVWLALDFSRDLLRRHWEWERNEFWSLQSSIGVLGIVRSHDGTEVMHFSDLGCCWDYSTARLFTTPDRWSSPVASDQTALSKPMTRIENARMPIRYEAQFDLAPGDYELRLALSDGARVGRIQAELRIENPEGQALALSSAMLGKRVQDAKVAAEEMAAAENFAPQYVPMVSKGVQVAPTGDTSFRGNEEMLAYFEVYGPQPVSSPPKVQAHLRISDAATGEIKKDLGSFDASPYANPGSTTIPILVRIPFNTLGKGSYKLEVQAADSSGHSTPWHSAAFTVE